MRKVTRVIGAALLVAAAVAMDRGVAARQVLDPVETRSTLALAPAPEGQTQTVTLTVTVVSAVENGPTPLGAVEFLDDARRLGTAPLIVTENGVAAAIRVTLTDAGPHPLRARYLGNEESAPSQSNPITHVVIVQ